MVLTGYNHPGQYSLKWSILVNTSWSDQLEFSSGFVFVMDSYIGPGFGIHFKRQEKKWTISSLPRVLIISFNTLALTSALQSGHLTLTFFFILMGTIKVPYRIIRLILTQLQL